MPLAADDCRHADVVVIGGGPGGASAATLLARKGFRVLLLERARFPRDHVGESLLPASLPILQELGVLESVAAEGFVEKQGATMVWGSDPEPWSWYFRETSERTPHSYQVWRPRFDQLLLENARRAGVDVREGHRVRGVEFRDGRACGVAYTDPDGASGRADAAFVVDASGQAALLGTELGLRQWDPFFRNLAVYAYYSGAEHLAPPDQGNIFIESYEHGWLWHIPLHTGVCSVGAVVDREHARIERDGASAFLRDQVAQAPRTAGLLATAECKSGPFVARDWSYRSTRMVGDGYILVGDAACFVDPLFSSGVHLALSSGVLAAAYVTSALRDESLREPAARAYERLYTTQYEHFYQLARLFYSSNRTRDSYFWQARRLLDDDPSFSPRESFVRAVAGQPPQGYERVVLDRGTAPAGFHRSVSEVQSDRARRSAEVADLLRSESALDAIIPRLASGLRVERRPVLGEGEFVWGDAIVTSDRPDELPCSPLVKLLLATIDGQRSVGQIASAIARAADASQRELIVRHVVEAARVLYTDGLLTDLHRAGSPPPA